MTEKKQPEYASKISKHLKESGAMSARHWEWTNDPPPNVERSEEVERAIWEHHIAKRIIEKHNIRKADGSYFRYRFINKDVDEQDVLNMIWKTSALCKKIDFAPDGVPDGSPNDPYTGPDNFTELVVCYLRDTDAGNTKIPSNNGQLVDLKDVFHIFLKDIFKEKNLPEFLEMLRRDGLSSKVPAVNQNQENIDSPTSSASAWGKAGADKRWTHYNAMMDKALQVADKKWADGDEAYHNEMSEYLVCKQEFKTLSKSALQKKLIPIADKYGRTRGKKGSTRKKK
jgi:hypothetical protein